MRIAFEKSRIAYLEVDLLHIESSLREDVEVLAAVGVRWGMKSSAPRTAAIGGGGTRLTEGSSWHPGRWVESRYV
jgi:hypothetical protein